MFPSKDRKVLPFQQSQYGFRRLKWFFCNRFTVTTVLRDLPISKAFFNFAAGLALTVANLQSHTSLNLSKI